MTLLIIFGGLAFFFAAGVIWERVYQHARYKDLRDEGYLHDEAARIICDKFGASYQRTHRERKGG